MLSNLTNVCVQVERSVESVMHDLKQKFDAANQQHAAAQGQGKKAQQDIDVIRTAQKQVLEEVKRLCR